MNKLLSSFVIGSAVLSGYSLLAEVVDYDYLQSTGTGYFITDYTPHLQNSKIEIRVQLLSNSSGPIILANYGTTLKKSSSTTSPSQLLVNYDGTKFNHYYDPNNKDWSKASDPVADLSFIHTIVLEGPKMTVDGQTFLQDAQDANFNVPAGGPISIFGNAWPDSNGMLGWGNGVFRLYSVKAWDNGELVHEYVPCKDGTTVKIHDKVTGALLAPKVSTGLTCGSNFSDYYDLSAIPGGWSYKIHGESEQDVYNVNFFINTDKSYSWTVPEDVEELAVLLVGGGGAGGARGGGGGGGGGVLYEQNYAVNAGTTYTVAVGAGGPGATGIYDGGDNGKPTTLSVGSDVVFSVLGGGIGGGTLYTGGGDGACGGGSAQGGTPGTSTLSGYAAGGSTTSLGGGGAGMDSSANGANGGEGLVIDISGAEQVYGSGGGGGAISGTAGKGGTNAGDGGAASGTKDGYDAPANFGGGGGGSGNTANKQDGIKHGGNGGSGVLIIRYKEPDDCKHEFGEWVIDEEATGRHMGTRHHTCNLCGKTKTESFEFVRPVPVVWIGPSENGNWTDWQNWSGEIVPTVDPASGLADWVSIGSQGATIVINVNSNYTAQAPAVTQLQTEEGAWVKLVNGDPTCTNTLYALGNGGTWLARDNATLELSGPNVRGVFARPKDGNVYGSNYIRNNATIRATDGAGIKVVGAAFSESSNQSFISSGVGSKLEIVPPKSAQGLNNAGMTFLATNQAELAVVENGWVFGDTNNQQPVFTTFTAADGGKLLLGSTVMKGGFHHFTVGKDALIQLGAYEKNQTKSWLKLDDGVFQSNGTIVFGDVGSNSMTVDFVGDKAQVIAGGNIALGGTTSTGRNVTLNLAPNPAWTAADAKFVATAGKINFYAGVKINVDMAAFASFAQGVVKVPMARADGTASFGEIGQPAVTLQNLSAQEVRRANWTRAGREPKLVVEDNCLYLVLTKEKRGLSITIR